MKKFKKFCRWLDRICKLCIPTPNIYAIHTVSRRRLSEVVWQRSRKRSISL